jgi:hypothetical protein
MLLAVAAVAQAQDYMRTDNADNTVTITGYNGNPGATMTIPNTLDGWPVTAIDANAFNNFGGAFASLTSVTIPGSVTNVGDHVFYYCTNLVTVAIGANVASVGDFAFGSCTSLSNVYFQGNAPSLGGAYVFDSDASAKIYYLPGATNGWSSSFAGLPAILWNPHVLNNANFGIRSNRFGFTIAGTTNISLVVESCTNLLSPVWSPVTNISLAGGTASFSDAHWTNHPAGFYHFRAP